MKRSEGRWAKPENLKKKVRRIASLLEREYGLPERENPVDPLDVLIQTILSQNTNDLNRDRAYERLKSRFPRWKDVLLAKREDLVSAIRPGGLARQKARTIREVLHWVERGWGEFSLSFLRNMDSREIGTLIGSLKGVGPKTVHCLLLFGLGREAFPVDTHILRIGKRLGFIPERMDAQKAHDWMIPLIPRGKSLSLHLNLIRFGRDVCKAQHPRCSGCLLADECLFHSKYY